jgi:hypothetical protein
MTVDVERVRRAIIRLDSSRAGKLAREEIEAGESFREVIRSYGLENDEIEALRAIRNWRRDHGELPDAN